MSEEKLTKKQRKALEFRKKIDKKEKKPEEVHKEEVETKKKRKLQDKEEKKEASAPTGESTEEAPKKKRKTRRGKKGKGSGGSGPRFLLFVGNLPYDITETELVAHFKNCNPDSIRIRTDKGIAFLEFSNESKDIQSRMELGLRMHHSLLRNRKINVELTAGGGGNSSNRLEKIKVKNEKVLEERRERAKKEGKSDAGAEEDTSGIHPSRLNLMK